MRARTVNRAAGFPWWLERQHRAESPVVLNAYGSQYTKTLTPLDDGSVTLMWMLSGQVEDELVLLFAHLSDEDADSIYAADPGDLVATLVATNPLDDLLIVTNPADGRGVRVATVSISPNITDEAFDRFVEDAIRSSLKEEGASAAMTSAVADFMAVPA